jgi:hypothetical protein
MARSRSAQSNNDQYYLQQRHDDVMMRIRELEQINEEFETKNGKITIL